MLGQIIRAFRCVWDRVEQSRAAQGARYPCFGDNPLAEYFFNHAGPVTTGSAIIEIYHRHL